MKKSTKKNLRIAAMLYVVLLVVALGVSLAWFISNREVEVRSGDNMVITVGSHLEVGVVGDVSTEGSWGSVVTLNADKVCPDITGDGKNFYFPTTLDASDEPVLDSLDSFLYVNESDEADNYYIEVKLKFRTALAMDVYLANTSRVYGQDEDLDIPNDLTGTVSSDIIAGAVRVGLSEITVDEAGVETETLKSIWIPNDGYYLTKTPTGMEFSPSGEREQYGYLAPDNGEWNENTTSMTEAYWSAEDYASGKVLVGNGQLAQDITTADSRAVSSMINGGVPLVTFEGGSGMQEKTLLVRIWIEGTDREAHTNLNGGRIKYALDFLGISKEDYTDEEQEAFKGITMGESGLRYEDGTEPENEILYSFNGIDWATYSSTNTGFAADVAANNNTVYIRMAESATKKPSAVRVIK